MNEGITEHATTTRYVPAKGRGPLFGLHDGLGLYNPHWPYPYKKEYKFETPKKGVPHHGLKDLLHPTWPYKQQQQQQQNETYKANRCECIPEKVCVA